MRRKKSQSAIEFLLILIFMMIIVSGIMYIIGEYSIDLKRAEEKKVVDDYANSLVNEMYNLQQMENGFSRNISIPKYIMDNYNVTVNSSYLIVQDIAVDGGIGKYYYYLPGELKMKYYKNVTSNTVILSLSKKTPFESNYLYLG